MIEILAPAGSPESVIAAAENGANAVYLGQKRFSARAGAHNFTPEELKEAVSYCHARSIAVHQAINTVIFDDEVSEAASAIETAASCGVDALIVQDLGVMQLARAICPQMPLHASTQLAVHSPQGALLMQELGFDRVVLARELSLQEIKAIVEAVKIETEVFVHGALCMSLSGQCYLSAMIGTHSANRGSCAGTCRMPFTATGKPDHCLSLKDSCLAEYVDKLQQLGVTSLKIEGRMKRPEYTAATAAAYAAVAKGEEYDRMTLQQVFSRSGFTDGYLTGKTGAAMFGTRQKEDVLAAQPAVLRSLQNTYKKVKSVVKTDISLNVPSDAESTLTMADGIHTVSVTGPVAETAQNKPLTDELAQKMLQKLGGTIFYADSCDCQIAPGVTLPASALNAMRREAAEKLYALRAECRQKPVFPDKIPEISLPEASRRRPTFRLQFASFAQMDPSVFELPYDIILPVEEILAHQAQLESIKEYLIAAPERALFGREETIIEQLKSLRQYGVTRLLVSNPAHLRIGKQLQFTLIGDSFLNITNQLAAKEWQRAGLSEITLSIECSFDRAKRLAMPVPTGFIAYGYYPVMLTRNCPAKASIGCANCNQHQKLTDRTGASFPLVCHSRRWNELLNGKPILLSDRMKELDCFDFATLLFTTETAEECLQIITQYEEELPPKQSFTRGLYYRSVE